MDIAAIEPHLAGLEGARTQVDGSRATWRVNDRLVARLEDAETPLVRSLPDAANVSLPTTTSTSRLRWRHASRCSSTWRPQTRTPLIALTARGNSSAPGP